jgi:hypothetical protein
VQIVRLNVRKATSDVQYSANNIYFDQLGEILITALDKVTARYAPRRSHGTQIRELRRGV